VRGNSVNSGFITPFDSSERVEVAADSCGVAVIEAPFDGGKRVEVVVNSFAVVLVGVIEEERTRTMLLTPRDPMIVEADLED
jgi:hypothetical protein